MSHSTVKFLLPMLLVCGAVGCQRAAEADNAPAQSAAAGEAPGVDARAEEEAIRTLSRQWLTSHQNRDTNAVMTHYADDAVTVYGATPVTGRDAIRQSLVDEYAKAARERPGFAPSWEITAIEVARAGDLAYEAGTYDDAWDGGRRHERGHFLTVWRKVGGQWKVARDMTVPEPAAPPATRPAP